MGEGKEEKADGFSEGISERAAMFGSSDSVKGAPLIRLKSCHEDLFIEYSPRISRGNRYHPIDSWVAPRRRRVSIPRGKEGGASYWPRFP